MDESIRDYHSHAFKIPALQEADADAALDAIKYRRKAIPRVLRSSEIAATKACAKKTLDNIQSGEPVTCFSIGCLLTEIAHHARRARSDAKRHRAVDLYKLLDAAMRSDERAAAACDAADRIMQSLQQADKLREKAAKLRAEAEKIERDLNG